MTLFSCTALIVTLVLGLLLFLQVNSVNLFVYYSTKLQFLIICFFYFLMCYQFFNLTIEKVNFFLKLYAENFNLKSKVNMVGYYRNKLDFIHSNYLRN